MGLSRAMPGKPGFADHGDPGARRHIGKRMDGCPERDCNGGIHGLHETEICDFNGSGIEFCGSAADVADQQQGCGYDL